MKIVQACIYSFIGILIIALDRVTKAKAFTFCVYPCIVNRYVTFEFVLNRGISWGFLHSDNTVLFLTISLTISIVTIIVAWYAIQRFFAGYFILGELCIVAGSLSNLYDRFYYQGVIDFIVLSYNGYSWPVFNVADIFIVVGVFLLLITYYKS